MSNAKLLGTNMRGNKFLEKEKENQWCILTVYLLLLSEVDLVVTVRNDQSSTMSLLLTERARSNIITAKYPDQLDHFLDIRVPGHLDQALGVGLGTAVRILAHIFMTGIDPGLTPPVLLHTKMIIYAMTVARILVIGREAVATLHRSVLFQKGGRGIITRWRWMVKPKRKLL